MKYIAAIMAGSLALSPLLAQAAAPKPTIVLVHGALETSEVWSVVVEKLQRDGYTVTNIDLPGRRGNELAMGDVTLSLYQQTVAKAISDEKRPVVLVGHSFGGFTISAEAEAEPEKIKTLVYVAAYIPQSGQSLVTLAAADKGSRLAPILQIDKEKGYASVTPSAGGAVFASDAKGAVQRLVATGIVNEPLAPLVTPITLTTARFGSVDKVDIRSLRDQVISSPFQTEMMRTTPVRMKETINTGHTPFITQPAALAIEIEKAAQ